MKGLLKSLVLYGLLLSTARVAFTGDDYNPTTLVFPSFLHTLGIRKATKTHLRLYTRNRVQVRDPQGISVVRLQSWDDPDDHKDDDKVTGYGIDSGQNIIVYNTSMRSLSIYGVNETGARALQAPTGVAASEEGDVYVADTGRHRIVRLFNPNKNVEFVRAIGTRGGQPGQFQAPNGIALDSQNRVYVSDTGNHRVQVLLPDNSLYLWFGKQGVEAGQLWHPTGIAVTDKWEAWSFYKDDFIALVDLDHTRVQKFTLEGKFLGAVRLREFGFTEGHLAYVAIDYYSNIWVTDSQNHCIHKFDRKLNYLTSFGRKGTDDKEFIEPRGIAIYRRFGQVFVAEKESAQYYWIGTDVFDFEIEMDSKRKAFEMSFFLTEPSYLTLSVENKATDMQTVSFEKKQYFAGPQTLYLDGLGKALTDHLGSERGQNGARLPKPESASITPGEYKFTLKAEPTYSSYKYFSKELRKTITID